MNKCARDIHFYTYKPSDILWGISQTMLTQVRRRKMWRLNRIYIVCSQAAPLNMIRYRYGTPNNP